MQPPPDYARAGGDQPNFLVINILDGRGFVAHTESGVELAKPPNPMVEVHCDGQTVRTEFRSRTSEPVWREELELAVTDPAQTLTLKVLGHRKTINPWKKEHFLGQCRLSLYELKEELDPK